MRRAALIGGLLTLAVLWFAAVGSWVTADRPTVAGTPSLGGLESAATVRLAPGSSACVGPVPLLPTIRAVRVVIDAPRGPVPLEVALDGQGYTARASAPASATAPDSGATDVAVKPPAHEVDGSVCVRNVGSHAVGIVGTAEPRSQTAAASTVDGRPVPDLSLTLYGEPRPPISHLGEIIGRTATMSGVIPTWAAWLIWIAFFVVVPPLAVVTVALSFRDEEPGMNER